MGFYHGWHKFMSVYSTRLEKKIAQTNAKIEKMERDKETKEDLKTVALGTSKINYLDPRISVAWCKRHEVPIEKVGPFSTVWKCLPCFYSFLRSFLPLTLSKLYFFFYRYSTNLFWQNLLGQWMLILVSDSDTFGSCSSSGLLHHPFYWPLSCTP